MDAAMRTMRRVGSELVQEHKKLFLDEKGPGVSDDWQRKDLLSALVKANLDPSIPESQRMNDEDVLSRELSLTCRLSGTKLLKFRCLLEIPTFLIAGHETSRLDRSFEIYEILTIVLS